jgi:3-phosphoshikimate 1-carboxyvinyltransferase
MTAFIVTPRAPAGGRLQVPGDKSISHRALLLGAIADGTTTISGFLAGEDCLATLAALQAMGVQIQRPEPTTVVVEGVGLRGLQAPAGALDMGNSGTAMRLFAGLLAGQAFDTELTGDESLLRRPMGRVAKPLAQMGASITTVNDRPPLIIRGNPSLHGIDYPMPVASAQVKSALLLAGLYAGGETCVHEPAPTRDHTERMLTQFGVAVNRAEDRVCVASGQSLQADAIAVPGDLSSAAFFLLAGCLAPADGVLQMDGVGLNPTRTGILQILQMMGADIQVEQQAGQTSHAEPVGRLTVRPSTLAGIEVPPELVPLAIDEFPLVFVAAALAQGETLISGAEELRHKESDRISVMLDGLRALGVAVEERPDGALIAGGGLGPGQVNSGGDHRVAMAFAIGASVAQGPVSILDTANVATSFPDFARQAQDIGINLRVNTDD